ncbi:uncharacterized protein LOC124157736 [Ischnura elegans]|uniref:uncharacterized protein LOC124157736 n=1 Tax=Ischnura elegans TaxID=197161 RepID=UPI001ED8B728|nr:uncharacterized protein LOC124157736 [Ischnura elegans]
MHGKVRGHYKLMIVMALLLKPTKSIPEDPWKNYWFGNGILGKAEIFNTTVCFTVPLFSFTFPSSNKEEMICEVRDGVESCLPSQSSETELFKQNVLGQAIFFGVTAISVASSVVFPLFLKYHDYESTPEGSSTMDNQIITSNEIEE